MSFLSVLGKIGKFALPFIPGVGPVADKVIGGVMDGIGIAGDIAGGAANSRAQDRGARAEYDLLRQQIENNRIGDANSQGLAYATARRGAETDRLRQIGGADMLANSKPPTDPRARLSGAGYMNPETIALMRERAMQALQSGSDVPEMQRTMPTPTMPQGTGMDSFLRVLQASGMGANALREFGARQQRPVPGAEQVGDINQLAGVLPQGQQEPIPWWLRQAPPTMGGD